MLLLAEAMERYYALRTTRRRTPFVLVRGLSNWLHSPLINTGNGTWGQGPVVDNFAQGYEYAIATATSVVMSTLQLRCERGQYVSSEASAAGHGHRPRPTPGSCTYTIPYQ